MREETMLDGPVTSEIPETDDGCVVWHCRQLRTRDQAALAYAAREYNELLPVFIFDPSFYGSDGLACDARIRFLHESVLDLSEQYQAKGCGEGGVCCHGDPVTVLSRFREKGWDVVTTAEPTGRYGLRRDNAVAEACDVTFVHDDGLVRTGDTRAGWGEQIEEWFRSEPMSWDAESVRVPCVSGGVSVDEIESVYGVDPVKTGVSRGGSTAAVDVLEGFVNSFGEYPGSISSPSKARTGTSQLSPYLRFGCVSVRRVYQRVDEVFDDSRAKRMFLSRLVWNRHYSQKLVDWPGWMDEAVNPVMKGFHAESFDEELVTAWKNGVTGYPLVDASMRCLRETGWLNFRMRAMCASFLCDLLQQPWKVGADWFYYHLIDADPAINYTQFQIQAGVTGANMMRVYNPRKQVRDNDADGEFIKEWVPELRELPVQYLDRPERTPVHVQRECGVSIGEEYPYPVVEYEVARNSILDRFESVREEAERALENPEVARRVSFARGGARMASGSEQGRRVGDGDSGSGEGNKGDDGGSGQSSFDAFVE